MSVKLSVDQAIMKARSHVKKKEIVEAQKLYQDVLLAFPNNTRAQQGLAALNNYAQDNAIQTPPAEALNQLVNLYDQGLLVAVIEEAQILIKHYPQAFIVWNILGAANIGLRQTEKALEAFKKVTELKPNYADGYINLGITLKDQGKLDDAIDSFNKALLIKPDYAEAYNNLGNVFKYQGKLDKARNAYNKALLLKPDYTEAHYNMGITLKEEGKLDEAIETFNKVLLLKSDYAEAHNNKGSVFIDQGKLDEAIKSFNNALSLKPNYAEAYNNIGVTLQNQGKLDEAIEAYNNALALKPDYTEAYNNIGLTFQSKGRFDEALDAYKKALSLRPNYAEVYNNIGNVYKNKGELNEAIEAFNRALTFKPDYAEAHNNKGATFIDQCKPDEAIEAFHKALSLKPDYADALSNMGSAFKDHGKLEASLEAYHKALSLKPDFPEAHHNMSYTLLNSGRVKEGLDSYEWRFETEVFKSHKRHFSKPFLNKKQRLYNKTILLWSEQGIGDTIRWSSCLSLLEAQAKHCILECQEKLVPLLKRSFPNVEIKPENKSFDMERDDFDFHLPMGSLYRQFNDKIDTNAKSASHLVPNAERVTFWKERLKGIGKGPYIGIAWKSSNTLPDKLPNNTQITEWLPILNIPDTTFVNLQYINFECDLNKIEDKFGVKVNNFNDLDHFNDIDDVAALCAALDMVISTQTSVPIISGGVGTPTKVLNYRQSSCNNILLSPSGPSVNVFERNLWEPWDNVFNLIAEDVFNLKNNTNKHYGNS